MYPICHSLLFFQNWKSQVDELSCISALSSCFSPTLLTMIGHLQRPMYVDDIAMLTLVLQLLLMVTLFQSTFFACLHSTSIFLFLRSPMQSCRMVCDRVPKWRRNLVHVVGTARLSLQDSYLRPHRQWSVGLIVVCAVTATRCVVHECLRPHPRLTRGDMWGSLLFMASLWMRYGKPFVCGLTRSKLCVPYVCRPQPHPHPHPHPQRDHYPR